MTKRGDSVLQAVARALCEAQWGEGSWDSDALCEAERTEYFVMADAALVAYVRHPQGQTKQRRIGWYAGRKAAACCLPARLNDPPPKNDFELGRMLGLADYAQRILALKPPSAAP